MERAVVGRAAELDVVDEFLAAAAGAAARLLVEGEPGIGKTTIWQAAVTRGRERAFRVLASRPGAGETRLTFAGLGDLLADVGDDVLDALPVPQRRALRVALLRDDPEGPAFQRREVATAFLGVLRTLAADSPVLVAVDDLQWLDRPSRGVLDFALRRLEAEPVGVLAATRPGGDGTSAFTELRGTRIRLQPLSLASLHEVLRAELQTSFPRPALVRIETVSSGNPFFAIELGRALAEAGEPVRGAAPLPVPDDLTELISGRLRRLPARVRRVLLEASALSAPTLDLLDSSSIDEAEAAGVVRTDGRRAVYFAHPLLAASVYANASAPERQEVHRELAGRVASPEERARHLALAATEPDEDVAHMLAKAGQSARDRGAPDAAIELLELACDLTPGETEKLLTRKLDLGRYLSEAGDPRRAASVLRAVADDARAGIVGARALLLLAYISETGEASESAAALCEKALSAAGDDIDLRIEILASASRLSDHDLPQKLGYARAAMELAEAGDATQQLQSYALLALAEASFFAGAGLDRELLRRAAELESGAAGEGRPAAGRSLHRVHHYSDIRPSARLRGILCIYADELDEARTEFALEEEVAREHGDEVQLTRSLIRLGLIELRAGNWELARRHLQEAETLADRNRLEALRRWMLGTRSLLDASCGHAEEARAMAAEALELTAAAHDPWGQAECQAALGFLDLSLGDMEAASAQLDAAAELSEQIGLVEPRLLRLEGDRIEALVALGDLDSAAAALRGLDPAASSWAAAIGARGRALVASARGDTEEAASGIEQALLAHQRLPLPLEHARTLLTKGQIARRRNERRVAREAIDESIAIFEMLGARIWTERARRERDRLGLRRGSGDELTPTEQTIASLAASGLTNRQIAERVFVSPKTVEANLARAYRKLGIHSRAELGALMASLERAET